MVAASTTLAGFGAVAPGMVLTPGANKAYLVPRLAFSRPLVYVLDGDRPRSGV